jgi:large subunit ribosomal protein L4
MPTLPILTKENKTAGEKSLSEKVFGAPLNRHLLWEAVRNYMDNHRRGTSSTKTRGEVCGGGKKPWKQKGTGRARAGSNRSPLWYKGGITFGPKPRDYSWQMPQKMKQQALRVALSSKVKDSQFVVLEDLTMAQPKTKEMAGVLKALSLGGRITCVIKNADEKLKLASRNLPNLDLMSTENITTYDVLNCDHLLVTREAVDRLEEKLG